MTNIIKNHKPVWNTNTTITSSSGTPIFEIRNSEEIFINVEWLPKKDITTYELAMSVPFISSKHIVHSVSCEDYDSLVPEVKRHFKVCENSLYNFSEYLKKKNINILREKL